MTAILITVAPSCRHFAVRSGAGGSRSDKGGNIAQGALNLGQDLFVVKMSSSRIILSLGRYTLPLALVFISFVPIFTTANTVTGNFDDSAAGGSSGKKVIYPHKPLELKCTINKSGYTFIWKKGTEEIKDGIESKKESDESFVSTLTVLKPTDESTGDYECIAKLNNSETESKATFNVVSLPTATLDNDVIVVEGEKLVLDCHPTGVPIPTVSWVLENMTLNSSTERIKLLPGKNNVTNAALQIADVKLSDRGDYKCVLSNTATRIADKDVEDVAKVRVKDKLAALWPFLGICAEVFVLCAIIFIYEKKRNKAELDESDTDNSPEQKNTPDHGKDSVRQRK